MKTNMENIKLEHFSDQVISLNHHDLANAEKLPGPLLITTKVQYETYYSPFDFIKEDAKVVIVGITPGMQQAKNALLKASEILKAGGTVDQARKEAKVFASFSGSMRNNLVQMLDHIGLNQYLGIDSTQSLFKENDSLVHFTSALRYPVFKDGKNFNESPLKLKEQVIAWFAEECKLLPNAIYVPLGPKVADVLELMIELGILNSEQVLIGLQHPSPANAERIAYFLERKDRTKLSKVTNPVTIDKAKQSILSKMRFLTKGEDLVA